jgi:hypothetical protein
MKYDDDLLRIGILTRLQRHGPQEFREFENRLAIRQLRRVMQGLLDAQLVRHHRPDGRIFRIEPEGAEVLESLVEQFRRAGREEEVKDIMEAWA